MVINKTDPWATEEQKEFYATLGWALTQWEAVEFGLCDIYCDLAQGNYFAVKAAYYSVISFEAKLNMVDGVARHRFHNVNHLPAWNKLKEKIKKSAKSRNKLAHFSVIHGSPNNNPQANIYLSPSFNNIASLNKGSVSQLSIREIKQAGIGFHSLANNINIFRKQSGLSS